MSLFGIRTHLNFLFFFLSVTMKAIDCLPTLCTLVRTHGLLVMIRVLQLLQCCVTNILKHVVEYFPEIVVRCP